MTVRVKLDENLDVRLVAMLGASGIDVSTVYDESLSGAPDDVVLEACRSEERVLFTLDLDFSNPLRFPPSATSGLVVLRPRRPTLDQTRDLIHQLLPHLASREIRGRLWIVEIGRIRIYDPNSDETPRDG